MLCDHPEKQEEDNHKYMHILTFMVGGSGPPESKNRFKQETIEKSNEKPTVPTQGQNYSKVTLHTKTFPPIPIM
jgi:hypothetical protein